jgi:hypothetical protein
MAIALEFVNLIMPVRRVRDLYPGGWEAYLGDNVRRIGKVMWYDSSLVRATGCMCADEVNSLIARYTRLGFTATQRLTERFAGQTSVLQMPSVAFSMIACGSLWRIV